VLVFSSFFIVQFFLFFFFLHGGVSLPWGLCWFIPGVSGGGVMLGAHLFGLLNISQAGLEPASGSMVALLFSQCNVMWRSFPQARVQDIEVLILLAALFPPSVAPVSQ
jgi:hypothetical protein